MMKKTRQQEKKQKRYQITVEDLHESMQIVSVIDTKKDEFMSLDWAKAKKIFKAWLAKHMKKHPRTIVTVYAFDEDMDPMRMLLQELPAA